MLHGRWRREAGIASDVHLFKFFLRNTASFTLIIIVKSFSIRHDLDDSVSNATLDEIFQLNALGHGRLGHVKQLIFEIIYLVVVLESLGELVDDCSEEHVDDESVNGTFVEHIEDSPEVLQALGTLLVLHSQHEVKEVFVIHFSFVGLILFKNTINKNVRKSR